MKDYMVVYEQGADGGWGAHAPDVPGCYALGDSRAEVERNMRESITVHLDELRSQGLAIPDTRNFVGVISVPSV